MPQAYGVSSFNPGDLTVGTISGGLIGSGMLYPGQTGIQTGKTFYYASFPDASTGWNALVNYIQRHISSGASTLGQLTKLFDGSSTYLGNVIKGAGKAGLSGLTGSSPINASEANQIAVGIATAEGTTSIIPFRYQPAKPARVSPPLQHQIPASTSAEASQISPIIQPASSPGFLGGILRRHSPASPPADPSQQPVDKLEPVSMPTYSGALKPGSQASSEGAKPLGSASALPSSGSLSSSSELPPSPLQIARGVAWQVRHDQQGQAASPENGGSKLSKLSVYIETHTDFLNFFLPALKQIVDVVPLPPAAKTAFDDAYAKAPGVIMAGSDLLSEIKGGAAQPALSDVALAFTGQAPVAPATLTPAGTYAAAPAPAAVLPAPTPVAPAPIPVPVAPITPVAPTAAQNAQPTSNPGALVPAASAPALPLTVADPNSPGATFTPAQIAALARSMGLVVEDSSGNVVQGV